MGIKILGVSGSMRDGSRSRRALQRVLDAAQQRGAETRMLCLREADLPMFRPRERAVCDSVIQADESVKWADAFVLATPDYHGSMSGAMKNFLDYHWNHLAGKLFGYMCTSHEKGLTVMDQMRTAVRQCYGWSMPYGLSIDPDAVFDKEGSIKDPNFEKRLEMMARDMVVYGGLIRQQFTSDLQSDQTDTFAAKYRK